MIEIIGLAVAFVIFLIWYSRYDDLSTCDPPSDVCPLWWVMKRRR